MPRPALRRGISVTEHADDLVVRLDAELAELVPFFMELRRQNIAEIVSALEKADFERVRWLGHNIKGAGGSYGFDRVSALGLALERAAVARDGRKVGRLVAELTDYLERVQVRFD